MVEARAVGCPRPVLRRERPVVTTPRDAPAGVGPPRATLRELRQEREVTQRQLATTVGMSQSDLSKAEPCSDPKLSTVRALGEGLELRLVAVDPGTGAAREIAIP